MIEATHQSAIARFSCLQSILCCPRTKAELRLVPLQELLSFLAKDENQRIPDGTIGAFVSDAEQIAYPLTKKVAYFLKDKSLKIFNEHSKTTPVVDPRIPTDDDITQSVQSWYDQFGWKKNENGVYNDSALFSQVRPIGNGLYELMSHISILDRLPGGDFILDAASGAIPHQEYMAFSWYFTSRVCVDHSITAIEEASMKLGEKDFCCLADICELPFRDDCFDGAISGYTIQHIAEHLQFVAIKEIFRVIKPNAHLCILTDVTYSVWHKGLFHCLMAARTLFEILHLIVPYTPAKSGSKRIAPYALYYFGRSRAWWKNISIDLTKEYSIESLRILNKREFERLFGQSNRAAKALKLVEAAFPRLTSFMSAYCLVDLCKPDPNTAKRKRWLRRSKVNPISVGKSYWGSTVRRNGLGHGSPTQRLMAAFKVDAPHFSRRLSVAKRSRGR